MRRPRRPSRPRRPRDLLGGGVMAGVAMMMLFGGWQLATAAAPAPTVEAVTSVQTSVDTELRTVKRVTKGRVITLPSGTKVVHVPLIIIHTDHHTIRVPAHNLPIRRVDQGGDLQAATVAQPLEPVTVTVYVPTTIYVPTTETVTVPASTETVTIPTTITLPFVPDPTTSDQGGTTP